MFTPQEVREHTTFEKAVFGGYSMTAVDEFMTPLAEDYSTLYKENAVLKSKMKVLVDRLEEYRRQEDSMNRAMILAQKNADELIAETERKCARLMSETEQNLRLRSQELQAELDSETRRVAEAKTAASAFIQDMELQFNRCLQQLRQLRQTAGLEEEDAAPAPRPTRDAPAQLWPQADTAARPKAASQGDISREIEANLSKLLTDSNTDTNALEDTIVARPEGAKAD